MRLSTQENFILKAARLADTSPLAWSEFVHAAGAYLDTLKDQLTDAPKVNLEVAQGRAQSVKYLVAMCTTCREDAEKVKLKLAKE